MARFYRVRLSMRQPIGRPKAAVPTTYGLNPVTVPLLDRRSMAKTDDGGSISPYWCFSIHDLQRLLRVFNHLAMAFGMPTWKMRFGGNYEKGTLETG
jgi:hypothetical protein